MYGIVPQKVFDEESYKENINAFMALKELFSFLYPVLREEDYGVDVSIYNGFVAYQKQAEPLAYIELEVKNNWVGQNFPFPDIQFLAKKQKFAKLDLPTYWVLFNRDCTECGIIPMRKIIICELDIVKCKNIGEDYFYRIPKNQMIWGKDKIERFLVHDSFQALKNEHNRFVNPVC